MTENKNPILKMNTGKNIKISELLRNTKSIIFNIIYNKLLRSKSNFFCPICHHTGPFLNIFPETGRRKHAECPGCGALERHRLQFLVMDEIFQKKDIAKMSMLHFAPEDFFKKIFRDKFKEYITADLYSNMVDFKEDITCLNFLDNSFDFIFASHVLEHVKDDLKALSEIKRVLKPGGIAVIPVPIASEKTVEYPEPNPHEHFHVRSPGKDYYDRYKIYFKNIKLYKSNDFKEKYQLYVYEDRTKKLKKIPLKPVVSGLRHIDIVPVCYN